MLNVILPIHGAVPCSDGADEAPQLFLEAVEDRPIIAWAMSHIEALDSPKRYFLISTDEFMSRHNIDRILPLFSDSEIRVVRLKKNTLGMPCSVLMAADRFNLDEPFLVSSVDQYVDTELKRHLDFFTRNEATAGCVGFHSVHSKWSYARVDDNNLVREVVEKVPISRNALTSTYYYSSGAVMLEAIKDSIMRGETVNGKYYLAPCFNEIILRNKKVMYSEIHSSNYYNFYSNRIIENFSKNIQNKDKKIIRLTRKYAEAFDKKDLNGVKAMLDRNVSLTDSFTPTIIGFEQVAQFYADLFDRVQKLAFTVARIASIDDDSTMIEFRLQIDEDRFEGVDILRFDRDRIVCLEAYLHKSFAEAGS